MRRIERGGLPLVQFNLLAGSPGLAHGITTRHGGVSPVPWDTLNLSVSTGDRAERVVENRARVVAAFGVNAEHVASTHQVHGLRAIRVLDQAPEALRQEPADVLVTDRPGRLLSMRFADCVPVLLHDPRRRAIAIAHAGWRGSAARVASAAVRALTTEFGCDPGDLLCGIGPSIGPCCYEVGEDVVGHFADRPRGVIREGRPRSVLDLWTLNRDDLVDAGVPFAQIEVGGVCTRCQASEYFSHRAAGGNPSGRFGALMGLL